MKKTDFSLEKNDISFLLSSTIIFTILNTLINGIGLWINKILSKGQYDYLSSLFIEFVKPLLVQSIVFAVCITLFYAFVKNKKLAAFAFTFAQVVIFHVIFFANLKIHHGVHFISSFQNPGLQYLSLNGQYPIDIVNLYMPLAGIFDDNVFHPVKTHYFYFQWIFLVLVYFAVISWLTFIIEQKIGGKKSLPKNPVSSDQTGVSTSEETVNSPA